MVPETKVCVSIGSMPVDTILSILSQVEMAEIRIDLVKPAKKELEAIFSAHQNLVATCREGEYNDEQRAQMLETAIAHGAAYIDVEADSKGLWRQRMTKIAKAGNCRLILSRHFYLHTPEPDELRQYADEMFGMGAGIVKIASRVNHPSDAAALLGLYHDYKNLVAIGMGTLGIITRLASPFLGAPFTFASFGENPATAPGQVEYREVSSFIEKMSSYG